jgi:hypothetical protein
MPRYSLNWIESLCDADFCIRNHIMAIVRKNTTIQDCMMAYQDCNVNMQPDFSGCVNKNLNEGV